MFQHAKLQATGTADARPVSAVSHGVGIAGMAGLIGWVAFARHFGLDGPYSALVNVLACGVPMVLWSLLVDKVHRRASTGITWHDVKPWRETVDISLTKLAGLWATWGLIGVIYATGRWYQQEPYPFAMMVVTAAAPALFVLSIPYVLWIDRRLVEPRDGAWAFGIWLMGQASAEDRAKIPGHLRAWGVKGFYLAFMLAIVPGGFGELVRGDIAAALSDPLQLAQWLITAMFVIDVAFATVGYLLTMRPLDAHIRSANPYAAGWAAALICYPPFILMNSGGPLDYHPGSADWTMWMANHPVAMVVMGYVLVALTAIYAWATVAFGLRFSNLTHRGVLTHGPYALSKHPAYLAKNLFWWLSGLPFLATSGMGDAVRNTLIMALVSGVYYWRARTEERHLMADPDYVAYAAWADRNAPVPRFFRWLRS